MKHLRFYTLVLYSSLAVACASEGVREPDLPRQADRWVEGIDIGPDTKLQFIGRTRELVITSLTETREVDSDPRVQVGDTLEGVAIGAIRCSFHWRDASHGGEQFMWRARWSCQAGRSRDEIENAVAPDGTKRFEYLYANPVRLDD